MEMAAIDLGTNSFHMVVADVGPRGDFEIVAREKEMLRLGDEVARTGEIGPTKGAEALATMARFQALCAAHGVRRIAACATSAVREATDGHELCDRIEADTGIDVRVITGEEEAALIYRAIRHAFALPGRRLTAIDIGGGSIEVMLGDDRGLAWATSLPLGVARLAARLAVDHLPRPRQRARLAAWVADALNEAARENAAHQATRAVGSSGTIEDFGRVLAAQRTGAVPAFAHGLVIERDELIALDDLLWSLPTKKKASLPGLDPRRADVAHVGSALLVAVMEALGLAEITVSDWALREGMLLHAIADIAPEVDEADPARARRAPGPALVRRAG